MEDLFYGVYEGLPRCGPGNAESTEHAYAALPHLPTHPCILDAGCGPGMQTRQLAALSGGLVVGLDNHRPFLDQLTASSLTSNPRGRVAPVVGDMGALPFHPESFDLIWSEGAVYIIGFEHGLRYWRDFLRPGGCVAVTEVTWLTENPCEELQAFWNAEYPDMAGAEENTARVEAAGYTMLDRFVLPEHAWWDHYYTPLAQRVSRFRASHGDTPSMAGFLDALDQEVDLYRRHAASYGYIFYIAQRKD